LFSKEQARLTLCYSHYRQNFSFLKKKFFDARIIFLVIRERLFSRTAGVHPTNSAPRTFAIGNTISLSIVRTFSFAKKPVLVSNFFAKVNGINQMMWKKTPAIFRIGFVARHCLERKGHRKRKRPSRFASKDGEFCE